MSTTPMHESCDATSEVIGQTAADLLSPLTDCTDCDVYLSRSLEIRMIPRVAVADVVWLEDASGAVCFFRLTPARFAGLVLEFQAQKTRFEAVRGIIPSTPADATALAKLTAIFENFASVMKILKMECVSRWPKVMAEYAKIVPEELKAPPRASDVWRETEKEIGPPLPVASTLRDEQVAELLAWADSSPAIPDAPFCPVPFAVVLDSRLWFSRLVAHAKASGSPKAMTRLHRMRRGLAIPTAESVATRAISRAAMKVA